MPLGSQCSHGVLKAHFAHNYTELDGKFQNAVYQSNCGLLYLSKNTQFFFRRYSIYINIPPVT